MRHLLLSCTHNELANKQTHCKPRPEDPGSVGRLCVNKSTMTLYFNTCALYHAAQLGGGARIGKEVMNKVHLQTVKAKIRQYNYKSPFFL